MKIRKAKPSKVLADPREHRRRVGLNQSSYWTRLGVTQSGGSRYESGRDMPAPLSILMVLLEQGVINDEQLENARSVVKATPGRS